jgi:hypothetical protein
MKTERFYYLIQQKNLYFGTLLWRKTFGIINLRIRRKQVAFSFRHRGRLSRSEIHLVLINFILSLKINSRAKSRNLIHTDYLVTTKVEYANKRKETLASKLNQANDDYRFNLYRVKFKTRKNQLMYAPKLWPRLICVSMFIQNVMCYYLDVHKHIINFKNLSFSG